MPVNKAIILAAGQGFQLDGVNKVLVRHPETGKTILDHALEAFEGKDITVVVGFRAIQIMESYPRLNFVINPDWALTNNAMSLGLALTEEPTYVVSGDIFFSKSLISMLDAAPENLALTENRENRSLTAIHCVTNTSGLICETYQGPIRNIEHPEAIGLFKISEPKTLQEWRRLCIRHGNLFAGQILPCHHAPIHSQLLGSHAFEEINTPADYLRLIHKTIRQ
ncbi:NTP transferase domain-containing protein [Methylomonas sp. 2BW1-5-20]|uniref:phosphocholine cytidylyltransferase family protein n=1 Tax=Methylomonas sp. 2BW1-5-20 TaxID=3376686 RepID=UPI0040532445